MLTANNPAAPKNTARFNMKERVYKLEPMVEQLLVHYATDGWLMHKASEDARKQQEVEKQVEEAAAKFQNEVMQPMTLHAAPHHQSCQHWLIFVDCWLHTVHSSVTHHNAGCTCLLGSTQQQTTCLPSCGNMSSKLCNLSLTSSEKTRKDYIVWHQFIEKLSISLRCPGLTSLSLQIRLTGPRRRRGKRAQMQRRVQTTAGSCAISSTSVNERHRR